MLYALKRGNAPRFHFPVDSYVVKLIKRGWRSDPLSLGIAALVIGAGVGGAAMGGAFSGGGDSGGGGGAAPATPPADTGALPGAPSIDSQAASRRLARMSKYFTSPSGVLDTPTGSAGVF